VGECRTLGSSTSVCGVRPGKNRGSAMTEPLYEKDLTSMKYAILTSRRHDRMVHEIATDLALPQLRVRRYIMDHFDMLLLENLPARYERGKMEENDSPEPERSLGARLYTRAVPLIREELMDET